MESTTLIRHTRSYKLISPSDWAFAGVFLAAACILALILWTGSGQGEMAVFRQHGEIVETLPLSSDSEVRLEGQYTTVFQIKDGTVTVVYTDCPNRQCQHMGDIGRAGQSIVCVPNEVSVTISGGSARADALTG